MQFLFEGRLVSRKCNKELQPRSVRRRTIKNQSEAKESQVSSPAGSVSSLKIGGVLLFY
jgi:hypothetical protein